MHGSTRTTYEEIAADLEKDYQVDMPRRAAPIFMTGHCPIASDEVKGLKADLGTGISEKNY